MTEYLRIDDDFEPEIVPERVVWLSDEQFDLVDKLFQRLAVPGGFEFHLVLGVAGTGKTQVLLSLGDDLREAGLSVCLGMSQSLKKSLVDAGFQIRTDDMSAGSIHLVDDPGTLADLKNAYTTAKNSRARALVVTIDPFQWTDSKALLRFAAYVDPELGHPEVIARSGILKRFRDVVYGASPQVHWLRTVYRQSELTGRSALELSQSIFRNMNPYIYADKQSEFEEITKSFADELLSNAKFEVGGGAFEVITTSNPTRELWERISKHLTKPDRWHWTDSALVVPQISELESRWSEYEVAIPGVSDVAGFDPEITLEELCTKHKLRWVLFGMPGSVRGEEFQEVLVSIDELKWAMIHRHKQGLGSQEWGEIMPLHVFVTRAKDQVTIIVNSS